MKPIWLISLILMLKLAIKPAAIEVTKPVPSINNGINNSSDNLNKNSKAVTGIIPTFLLRGVNPISVLTEYLEGKYFSLPIPSNKIKGSLSTSLVVSNRGINPDSEEYTYRDCSNQLRSVGTTNHEIFNLSKYSTGAELPICGCCNWCRETINKTPVGIPIKIKTNFLSFKDKEELLNQGIILSTLSTSRNVLTSYYTDGIYCTFQCALSGLLRESTGSRSFRDTNYSESEQLLRCLYEQANPSGGLLQKAPDWRLLKSNGGYLTSDQFHSNSYYYQSIPGVIVTPVKMCYTTISQPFSASKSNFYGITS